MKIGYGYKRKTATLEAAGAERVYIDGEGTERIERRYLFRDLREGDTLLLLATSDLGSGKGLQNMRAKLASRGVEIEVAAAPEKETPPSKMGRPSAWSPSPEADDRLRSLYLDVSVDGGYVINLACAEMGLDSTNQKHREMARQRLLRRYGKKLS